MKIRSVKEQYELRNQWSERKAGNHSSKSDDGK